MFLIMLSRIRLIRFEPGLPNINYLGKSLNLYLYYIILFKLEKIPIWAWVNCNDFYWMCKSILEELNLVT